MKRLAKIHPETLDRVSEKEDALKFIKKELFFHSVIRARQLQVRPPAARPFVPTLPYTH